MKTWAFKADDLRSYSVLWNIAVEYLALGKTGYTCGGARMEVGLDRKQHFPVCAVRRDPHGADHCPFNALA